MWSPFSPPGNALAFAVSISTAGDNTIRTPTLGFQTQLTYICLSAPGSNSADVVCRVKFGAGSPLYIVSLTPKAMWSRNIGAGRYALASGINTSLIVNLDGIQTVYVSIEYLENKGEQN